MPLPATTQDLQHGIDFTGLAVQTAAEHNQLVDIAIPYTDGTNEAEGIGLLIVTTDTASLTPSVPDPTTSSGYNKWKRYIWCRRPYVSDPAVPKMYMWDDSVSSITTYLKWCLVDPSSYVTLSGISRQVNDGVTNTDTSLVSATADFTSNDVGVLVTGAGIPVNTYIQSVTNSTTVVLTNATTATATGVTIVIGFTNGTPLQNALNTINTNAINALAAANSADAGVTTLTAELIVTNTNVTAVTNAEATDAAAITDIEIWAGGPVTAPTLPSVNNAGGVNGKLAALQSQITTAITNITQIGNLTPSVNIGDMIRTNAADNAVEWFSPAGANDLVVSAGTGTLTPGVWEIQCVFNGSIVITNTNSYKLLTVTVGTVGTITAEMPVISGTGFSGPICLFALGVVTISQANGNQAVTSVLTGGYTTSGVISLVCRKIAQAA